MTQVLSGVRCIYTQSGIQCALEHGHQDEEGKASKHLADIDEVVALMRGKKARVKPLKTAKLVGPMYQHMFRRPPLPTFEKTTAPIMPQGGIHQMVGPLHQPMRYDQIESAPPVEKPQTIEQAVGYSPTSEKEK